MAQVDIDFFDATETPILEGRAFDSGDLGEERSTVIVNATCVDQVLGGKNALGRCVRFVPWNGGEPGPWKEIVGVVGHLGIQVGGDPASFGPRFRALAAEVDPDAVVVIDGRLGDMYEGDYYLLLAMTLGGAVLSAILLVLASSGIYALMSFAVSERLTEIGVRAALGAPLAWLFLQQAAGSVATGALGALVLGVAVAVAALVGAAAWPGPTLRSLRVMASEVLRRE